MEEKRRNKVSTTELIEKVFLFCQALSGNLFPYQKQFALRIIRSIIENEGAEISGLLSRQSGKSQTVACVAGGCSIILPILANMPMFLNDKRLETFKDGYKVGIFAPALHQSQIVFNRIRDFFNSERACAVLTDAEVNVGFDTNNGQNIVLRMLNIGVTSTITCMSASDQSNIEGKSYMLIIVDEAQDVGNLKYRKSIRPMAAFFNGTSVVIGTPTTQRNFFYDTIERNKKSYEEDNARKNHYQYDWKTVIKYNPNYEKYVRGEMGKIGEDSDEFQMAYALRWMFERGMFIDPDKFDKLADDSIDLELENLEDISVVGIDLGKSKDSTVVTVLGVDWDNPYILEKSNDPEVPDYIVYDTWIRAWLEIQGDNWNDQYEQITDYLSRWRIGNCVMDATGVGNPIYDRVAANVNFPVIPYVFSTQSKSALMKFFDSQIKGNRFRYPAGEEARESREFQRFYEQFLGAEKSYNGQHLVIAGPTERNAHDDYVFSAALASWGIKQETSIPESSDNKLYKEQIKNSFFSARNKITARRR